MSITASKADVADAGDHSDATPTLRQYLDRINGRSDHLQVVTRQVRPQAFDVTGVLEHLDRLERYPAVFFTNPLDLRDQPAKAVLLANLFADRVRCAEMLGLDPSQAGAELGAAYAARVGHKIAPVIVPSTDAPVHANVLQGDQASFEVLPVVRHFEMDLGPVLTMAHVMRAPGEAFYNVTFAKTFPEDHGRRGGITIHTPDMSRMLREWARRGERVPIVNVLGHDPAFWLGSLALTPYGTNEYETIGGCVGRPVRLTPSVTWGESMMVPADAEIVVEGELIPGEKTVVNPFGEISRQYQAQELAPVMEVKAVTFREKPIMQEVYSAHREHFLLGLIPREGSILNLLRRELGNVTAVNLPYSGCGRFTCYISMQDPQEGQPKLAALKTLAAAPMFQTVVVVDADIDVFNEEDVLWAINMYVDPRRDVDLLKGMREPTDFRAMRDHRVLVDATRPRHIAFPTRPQVPRNALERIVLEEWLTDEPWEG